MNLNKLVTRSRILKNIEQEIVAIYLHLNLKILEQCLNISQVLKRNAVLLLLLFCTRTAESTKTGVGGLWPVRLLDPIKFLMTSVSSTVIGSNNGIGHKPHALDL